MNETSEFRIMDRAFLLSCPPEERPLLEQCVSLVDSKMRQIRDTGRVQGVDRIAVFAALNLARELLAGDRKATNLPVDLEEKIEKLRLLVDEALAPQQSLF